MSMFDHLRCNYPLPAPQEVQGIDYQTKSFDNVMDSYTIDVDGKLWVEEYDIEDHSDPEAETAIGKLAGMLTRTNRRQQWKHDFDGEVRFYSDYGTPDRNGWRPGWIEFQAVFASGRLQSLELIEDRVPPSIAAEREARQMEMDTPEATKAGDAMRRM